jgi:hypothetical protein
MTDKQLSYFPKVMVMSYMPQYPDKVPNLTRVVVVTPNGGAREFWGDEWQISVQDDGQTIKLFSKGDGHEAQSRASRALGQDLIHGLAFAKELAERIRRENAGDPPGSVQSVPTDSA